MKKFHISTLFDNSKFVKVISVLLAIIAWFIVATTVDVDASILVKGVNVDFNLTGTTPSSYGLNIVGGEGQTVDVKVEGKKYAIGSLNNDDFVAVPSFTTVTKPGTYTLPIEIRSSKSGVISEDYTVLPNSSSITVTFDYIVEKQFELTAIANNITAAEGFVKESVIPNPDTITVRGPETEIEKIAKVVIESNDQQAVLDDSATLHGSLVYYDSQNNILSPKDVTTAETNFEISVQIYQYATVPIEVSFVNVPSNIDISELDYSLSETEIEIAGPKSTISKIQSISLSDIDFRKINLYSTFDLKPQLPAGVENVRGLDYVAVFIESDELATKTITIDNFSPKNVPVGYDAKITTEAITNVTIVGNSDDISVVTSNDFIAVVNMQDTNLTGGSVKVPVQIYCSGNRHVWAVGEYNVVVVPTAKS